MEEDVGVKDGFVRLRRRLSVEQAEDVSSPSTPTKKRAGRLAAKPQLDLIDENAQISSPKKTRRKPLVKDIAEAEEKPVTPSRRSTRIKSNTSIVSETVSQTTDSPRARRALRRNSQAGSDNEGPVTPARQTRRTRKDSASSVENQEPAPASRPLPVIEMVIAEEPETESGNKSRSSPKTVAEELSPSSPRKSQRLSEKRNRRSGSYKTDHELSTSLVGNKSLNISAKDDNSEPKTKEKSKSQDRLNKSGENKSLNNSAKYEISEPEPKEKTKTKDQLNKSANKILNISAKDANSEHKMEAKTNSQDRLNKSGESKEITEEHSEPNKSWLKTLNEESQFDSSNHNKSVPSIDDNKKKRNRTESWPVVITSPANDNIMFSDNEQSKKKKKKSDSNYSWINNAGSSLNNTSIKEDKNKTVQNDNDDLQMLIESPSKRKKRKSEMSVSKEVEKPSEPLQSTEAIAPNEENANKITNQKSENEAVIKDNSNNAEKADLKTGNHGISSDLAKFFEKNPRNVQAIVYFEDSDSNSITTTTKKKEKFDSEDQCVPVVKRDISPLAANLITNAQENIFTAQPLLETVSCNEIINQVNEHDNSCEPMDIDETIHDEILQKSQQLLHTSVNERKSVSKRNSVSEESNKSKRKSSITANDTSKIENKSTLILSQLKDISKASDTAQSPKPPSIETLSKSTTNVHDNDKNIAKGDLSLNDLKGTPLKQINVQKLNMQTSTPIAMQQIDKNLETEEKSASSKKNSSNFSESVDESRSSEEESDEQSGQKSNLIDDEAEEASDDYESGDSRDDEERQYEDEHEIVEQGETLGSEEDLTNDSDYEKDSFVVSSDAEDDDLLSGSGDNLSMSEKELSMSKKSKDKYNARKLKEQKNASREMFESRHKLNTSGKKSPVPKTKNNRMRIDSSLLESDDEIVAKPKKSKRLRLDSTLDISHNQEDANESLNKSSKKGNKSAQKSICNESAINEKEITICNESVNDNNDPLKVQFKQEPKTPQKDLEMSVVQFTSRQEIENVEVEEEKSILNQTETDPLQATMAGEDTSDSSENEEIVQNYDSILKELNKNKKGKLSSNNLSLKIDKKTKKNKNEPILDQLNLTNTKIAKKTSKEQSQDVVDSKTPELSIAKQDSDVESGSSSIDLKLLFPEDNCESGDESKNNKMKGNGEEKEKMFVPLRKSTGKTNIRESVDDPFFIDTTGAQDNEKDDSSKLIEAPVEVLFSGKKKKKKDKLDMSQNKIEINDNEKPVETDSAKKKTKQKKRHSAVSDISDEGTTIIEESSSKRRSSDASKAHKSVAEGGTPVDAPYQNETENPENTPAVETGSGKKKKKNKKKQSAVSEQSVLFDEDSDGAPEEFPYQSEKAADLDPNLQKPENTDQVEPGSGKKKKNKKRAAASEPPAEISIIEESNSNSKKRKRKSSDSGKARDSVAEGSQESLETKALNESLSAGGQKKKRKISHQNEAIDQSDIQDNNETDGEKQAEKKKKKNREINFQNIAQETDTSQPPIKKNKKRKERDEDADRKNTKVSKENSFHEVHMPPLPDSILSQLDDKPRKITEEPKVISTSKFVVENARQKRSKPSKYLEQSIYLDADSPLAKKDKSRIKKPKVLPFIPTASISDSGFTTNFQIKKVSQNVDFVAGPAEITFSKETYLQKKGIKRLGTYEHYKKQISRKISKF